MSPIIAKVRVKEGCLVLTLEEIRREVRYFIALWLLIYPEDGDRPSDVLRRVAAVRVLRRIRRGEPPLSQLAQQPVRVDLVP